MNVIRAIIIDDEPLGRTLIREYLQDHPDIVIAAECCDAHEALEAIGRLHPHLLFLDVSMPEINGFEMLTMLDSHPHIIFSTAYDQYAIKAFEVNAVDYLLKPYDRERFNTALERARHSLSHRAEDRDQAIERLLASINPERKYLTRMLVKESGRIIILNTAEIHWVEAVEDYINIHTDAGAYLISQSMATFMKKLDPETFIRIHRSHAINLEAVKELRPWSNGRLKCVLTDGNEIVSSRSGAKTLRELLG
ncbi:LytTR family transcriptional regulator DNA-binding domain-containing protein [bacterium]|nr:LytTR family transcriptional regulator DNA-binding domain-containing protein [bacterium]